LFYTQKAKSRVYRSKCGIGYQNKNNLIIQFAGLKETGFRTDIALKSGANHIRSFSSLKRTIRAQNT